MPKYIAYCERKEVEFAIIEASSIEEAEELADNNYSDYEWQKLD